jgi:acrylyl-CoA reductase (NADPH)
VDNVGGSTLATALAQCVRHGAVASCGLAGGSDLVTTVMPFILRGVALLGIDSNECPRTTRRDAWSALAEALPESALSPLVTEVPLEDVPRVCEDILAGKVRGRTVVTVD